MRKPVQIAIACTDSVVIMMVRCDDGTMWERFCGGPWELLPDIPQEVEEPR